MKKQNKILSTFLTLAIVGTTLVPAASAVNPTEQPCEEQKCPSETTLVPAASAIDPAEQPCKGQKRPSETTSETAEKKVRAAEYPNPEFFSVYRIREQQVRQRVFDAFYSAKYKDYFEKNPEIRKKYLMTQMRLQPRQFTYLNLERIDVSGLSKEDRVFLCGMINESGDELFQRLNISDIPSKKIFDFVYCFNYLKICIDYAIVYESEDRWYEALKKTFDMVLKEESELALKKLLSNLTSRLNKPVDADDYFNKNYEKVFCDLAPCFVPSRYYPKLTNK